MTLLTNNKFLKSTLIYLVTTLQSYGRRNRQRKQFEKIKQYQVSIKQKFHCLLKTQFKLITKNKYTRVFVDRNQSAIDIQKNVRRWLVNYRNDDVITIYSESSLEEEFEIVKEYKFTTYEHLEKSFKRFFTKFIDNKKKRQEKINNIPIVIERLKTKNSFFSTIQSHLLKIYGVNLNNI